MNFVSRNLDEWVEDGRVGSGDKAAGMACGMEESKISDRRRVENVRFASSTVDIS